MPRPLFTPGKDPVPIVQKAGWAPGPVWTGVENLAPQKDSIPGPSSPQLFAIPTTLPGPRSSSTFLKINFLLISARFKPKGRRRAAEDGR
jgi:hypothetical protein